jgi:toxin ParE1/3/4
MRQCIIAPSASQDLDEIFDYFAARSVDAGDRFIEQFEQKCEYLRQFPKMGRSYAELLSGLRGLPLDGYIILYQVVREGVEILRVVSAYRDLDALFDDLN